MTYNLNNNVYWVDIHLNNYLYFLKNIIPNFQYNLIYIFSINDYH